MFNNFEIEKGKLRKIKLFGFFLLVLLGLTYAYLTNSQSICEEVEVSILNKNVYPFLNEKDVITLATNKGVDMLENKRLKDINLKLVEGRILKNTLVKNCEVSAGLNNRLKIDVVLQEPIARYVEESSSKSSYLNAEGKFLQLSPKFAARTLIVSGGYFRGKKTIEDKYYENDVIKFLNRIQRDPFWKAQIVEVNVDSARNITMIPLVGQHIVEFGRPLNIESKLQKLQLFHQKIMFDDKYKAFKRINVQYKNQIVCE